MFEKVSYFVHKFLRHNSTLQLLYILNKQTKLKILQKIMNKNKNKIYLAHSTILKKNPKRTNCCRMNILYNEDIVTDEKSFFVLSSDNSISIYLL